jgi:long-chain acyl-CoA synthetase
MRSATTGVEPPRLNLVSYIDDLPRRAGRQAYMWREGARWRSRTYADLHRRVLACAATLTAAGVGPGDPVIIQGPESADWVEALLGTFKAGAVAVPLDASTGAPFRARVAG